jgi:excisionase family DNA binding protein
MVERNVISNGTGRWKEYLTTTELAKFCGVSRFTILSWIDKGKISTIRTVGGKHRNPSPKLYRFWKLCSIGLLPRKRKSQHPEH